MPPPIGGAPPITSDPPFHADARRLLLEPFAPKAINALEPFTRAFCHELMDKALAKDAEQGWFDASADYTQAIPVRVIAEMLGVETERRDQFKRWSDEIVTGSSSGLEGPSLGKLLGAMGALHRYLRGVVRERRRNPADDLISVLVDERRGASLDDQEVAQFVILLLLAGNETTTNLIGNATRVLLDRPEVVAELKSRPELVPAMIARVRSPIFVCGSYWTIATDTRNPLIVVVATTATSAANQPIGSLGSAPRSTA